MKTPALATVYLDDELVWLMGDPRPRVAKIIAARGKHPESVQVVLGPASTGWHGKPLDLDDVIDRTADPVKPIYLTSRPRQAPPMGIESPGPATRGPARADL